MRITIEVEGPTERLLKLRAQALGLTPTELVRDAVDAQQSGSSLYPAHSKDVAALVRARWCDADIAAKLRLPNGRVSSIRRDLGLPPNRRSDPATARPQVTYGGHS